MARKKTTNQKKKGVAMDDKIRQGMLAKSIASDRYVPIEPTAERKQTLERSFSMAKEENNNKKGENTNSDVCHKG